MNCGCLIYDDGSRYYCATCKPMLDEMHEIFLDMSDLKERKGKD